MPTKQACAAVGQCELMYTYDKQFSEYGHVTAQVLLTRDVVEDDRRKSNVVNTLCRLLEYGAVPIINENDSIAVQIGKTNYCLYKGYDTVDTVSYGLYAVSSSGVKRRRSSAMFRSPSRFESLRPPGAVSRGASARC